MARNTTGYHVYKRGKGKAYWVWWSDGQGVKVQKRITDPQGNPIGPESSSQEANRQAARMYSEWCSHPQGDDQGTDGNKSGAEEYQHTLGELTAHFVRAHVQEWSKRTIASYRVKLSELEGFFDIGCLLDEIKPEHAEEFKIACSRSGDSAPNTVRGKVMMARRVFKYGKKLEWISRNPFDDMKIPKKKVLKQADPFTPEEVQRILATAREHHTGFYPILLTAAVTGERRNAIRLLNVGDLDFQIRGLRFRAETTKQRVEILRPLPSPVFDFLADIAKGRGPEEPLFATPTGTRWPEEDLNVFQNRENGDLRLFGKILVAAGVRPRGMHNFRSAVDTNLVAAGLSLDMAVALTGHTSQMAREAYLRPNMDVKRQSMDVLARIYGIGEPHKGEGASSGEIGESKFEVAMSKEDVALIEHLESPSCVDSGTGSGTTPPVMLTIPMKMSGNGKIPAIPAFAGMTLVETRRIPSCG
jgi:integrase